VLVLQPHQPAQLSAMNHFTTSVAMSLHIVLICFVVFRSVVVLFSLQVTRSHLETILRCTRLAGKVADVLLPQRQLGMKEII
jgi:hypothetical protein